MASTFSSIYLLNSLAANESTIILHPFEPRSWGAYRQQNRHCFGLRDARPRWIAANGDFHSAILSECKHFGLPDPAALLQIADGARDAIERDLRAQICTYVTRGKYSTAERLLCALADICTTGFPGIRGWEHFSREGDEMLLDFREADYGTGTRLLAEIAFNWGQ